MNRTRSAYAESEYNRDGRTDDEQLKKRNVHIFCYTPIHKPKSPMLIEQGRVTLHEFYLTSVSFLRQVRNRKFAFFRRLVFTRGRNNGEGSEYNR